MPKLNQRGVVHFLLPLILLLGIIAGVWLITNGNPLKLFSKAGGGPIWFTDVKGDTLPVKNNIPQTTSPKVRIELYSTLGPPLKSISSPVSFNPLVSNVYAQENTTCPGGCADSQGNGANGLKCDPQSWTRKDYTQCTSTGTYYYCYSSCSKPSSPGNPPVSDTKSCPGGTQACGGSSYDNLGSCSTSWSYSGNPDWNNWCLKNAGGADAYCYSCSVPTPASPPPTPTTPKCPGSCGNSDRSGLGQCIGGWEYTPKYNDSCGAQKYCYVCDNQIQNPTPPIPTPPQPPDAPPVGQPPPPPDIPVPPPTNPPEPTPKVRYTTSYRIAENPTDLAQAPWLNYTEEPSIVNKYSGGVYEFKDQTLGVKFIWVEFKANDGSIDRRSAQIEIVAPTSSPSPILTPSPTPTPTPSPTSPPTPSPSPTPTPAVTPSPTPTPTPKPSVLPISSSYKRVFKTSRYYDGNLGGLNGADQKCQQSASSANLGGTWQAWVSSSQASVVNRFTTRASVPYKIVDGRQIANHWSDLIDGSIATAINIDEYGAPSQDAGVWTNTTANGNTKYTNLAKTCQDWSSSRGCKIVGGRQYCSDTSRQGHDYYLGTNTQWTDYRDLDCSYSDSLYCFEQ